MVHFGGGGKLKPGALLEVDVGGAGGPVWGAGGLVTALGDWTVGGAAIALPVDGDKGTAGIWGLCVSQGRESQIEGHQNIPANF